MEDERPAFRSSRSNRLLPALIFLSSFAIHLVYILEVRSCALFDYPVLDMYWHRQWAAEILAGDWLGSGVFFRAPLYPFFLSFIMAFTGEGFFWPRVAQSVVGSITPVLVYFLALRLNPSRIWALAAGIISAFYPLFFFFNTEFLIPVLILPLDLALVLSLLRLRGEAPGPRWALPGIILGLSALARPTILAFIPGILIWLYIEREENSLKAAARRAGIFLFACFVIIAPVTIRNLMVGGDFVLISSQGGINFYIGNNPGSDGKTSVAPGGQLRMGSYRDSVWLVSELEAEKALGRDLKQSEVSDYWFKRGVKFILKNPSQSFPLFLKKIYFLLNGTEIPSNQSIYYYREESLLMRALLWPGPLKIPFGLLLPLSAAGMILLAQRRREYALLYLFVIIYASVVVAFFVNARFRLPLTPFLIIFAVHGTKALREALREGRKAKVIISGILFAALLALGNSNFFDVNKEDVSQSYRVMGYNYYEKTLYEKAGELFMKAYELNPDSPDNINALANMYYLEENYSLALDYYNRAAFIQPENPQVYVNLGMTCEAMGRDREAEKYYMIALKLSPEYTRAAEQLRSLRIRKARLKPETGQGR